MEGGYKYEIVSESYKQARLGVVEVPLGLNQGRALVLGAGGS